MDNLFSLLSVTNHLNSCKPGNFTCSNLTIETLEKGAKYVVMFSCSQVDLINFVKLVHIVQLSIFSENVFFLWWLLEKMGEPALYCKCSVVIAVP